MFDQLRSLLHAGPAAEPTLAPKPVVAAPALVAEVFEPETIAAPHEPEIVEAPAPAPVVARIRIEPEIVSFSSIPGAPAAAPEAVKLYDAAGVFRGILLPDGTFEGATSASSADPFASLSAEDRRPIDWEEESRIEGMSQRTPGRIQFLLHHETKEQRDARIQNDIHRGLAARTSIERDPEKSANAQSVNQWRI
jgi:hypothetical protein